MHKHLIMGFCFSRTKTIPLSIVQASFTLSRFSVQSSLQCGHRGPPGPHRSDADKHRIESGYTVMNRRSPGRSPGGFKKFKRTGTHRDAPGCDTTELQLYTKAKLNSN